MAFDRGTMGTLPWAAVGDGPPLVVLAGVSPATGVDSATLVHTTLAPVRHLAGTRRLYALNRRRDLPAGTTMATLAAEHADAFREYFGQPVDLLGVSTGGSIAQQVAAEHPDVVRRLVLVSTGCRLGPQARQEQEDLAVLLRAEEVRAAGALLMMDVVPTWAGPVGRGIGRAVAPWMLGGRRDRADLATTLEAEDAFDLAGLTPIQAPTLVVGGGRDRFYDVDLFRATAALIPDSTLLVVPRRGHITVVRDRRTRAHVGRFLA